MNPLPVVRIRLDVAYPVGNLMNWMTVIAWQAAHTAHNFRKLVSLVERYYRIGTTLSKQKNHWTFKVAERSPYSNCLGVRVALMLGDAMLCEEHYVPYPKPSDDTAARFERGKQVFPWMPAQLPPDNVTGLNGHDIGCICIDCNESREPEPVTIPSAPPKPKRSHHKKRPTTDV